MGQSVHDAVVIYCDNISSIMLANNPVYHARTKHIEVHYHFVREKVLAREIDLVYVSTEEQVADVFTMAMGTEKLHRFRRFLSLNSRGRGCLPFFPPVGWAPPRRGNSGQCGGGNVFII